MTAPDLSGLPAWAFAKRDASPDSRSYASPRLVTQIDAAAIAAVTELYRTVLPKRGAIRDLMSSWVSYLPDDVAYAAAIWTALGADDQGRLAGLYLRRAGFSDIETHTPLPEGGPNDPPTAIIGRAPRVMQYGTGAEPAV